MRRSMVSVVKSPIVVESSIPPPGAAPVAKLLAAGRSLAGITSRHTASATAIRPQRCCVYCGHELYVPPKVTFVRCPVCIREISVVDVVLNGDVQKGDEIVTAGKITVAMGARVAADLVACDVEVMGKVLGDVLASQVCRVRCTAKVSGHVLCRHLVLEPGAEVTGTIETIREVRR